MFSLIFLILCTLKNDSLLSMCIPNLAGVADLVSDKNLLRELPGCSQVVHSRNVPEQVLDLPNDPCWLRPVVNKCNNSRQRKSLRGIDRVEPCRGALGNRQSRRQLARNWHEGMFGFIRYFHMFIHFSCFMYGTFI